MWLVGWHRPETKLLWLLTEIILTNRTIGQIKGSRSKQKKSTRNSQHISLQMRIMYPCLNSTGLYKCVIAMCHFERQHNNAISNEIIWIKRKRDIVRGERCHFQKIMWPLRLHLSHNSSISSHCCDFTRCPEHCNKSSGAGERDVTDNLCCRVQGLTANRFLASPIQKWHRKQTKPKNPSFLCHFLWCLLTVTSMWASPLTI